MTHDPFPALPDSARLWLLALEPAPGPEALPLLIEGMEGILAGWRHKGHAYQGAFALLEGGILAVAEPELAAAPSGCAIDGMLRKVQRLVEARGLTVVDPATSVVARTAEGLRILPKVALEDILARGELGPDTPILDLALFSVGDLRAGKLEVPLEATWIGRRYRIA
jgi:hypothetical protein